MKNKVTLISCGIEIDNLSNKSMNIIETASILIAGQRLLDWFPDFTGGKIPLTTSVINGLNQLLPKIDKEKIVILASGDAMFHGIGKKLCALIPEENLTIFPNITAMQSLCSKIKLTWEDATLFSLHGKNQNPPIYNILASHLAIIYCDHKLTASKIAEQMIKTVPYSKKRQGVIAENLGLSNERIITGTLAELSTYDIGSLSILTLLPTVDEVLDNGITLGLPDDHYLHDAGMITHSEVRAIAVSKLKLGSGVMWDLGACTGSVGIEAASLCKDLTVYAVEKHFGRYKSLEMNVDSFGCANVICSEGNILEIIDTLPSPRAVFIGGGGKDIANIAESCFEKLLPGGRIVVPAVLLETQAALSNILQKYCIEVISISICRSKKLGDNRLMKSDNTVQLYIYEKPREN